MRHWRSGLLPWLICAASLLLLYGPVLVRLGKDWLTDDNYSHGLLIIPLAAYFAWERRSTIRLAGTQPRTLGLLVVVAGLGVLLAGILGAELFLARVSLVIVLGGSVLFLAGWRPLKALAFPLLFLVLMIPIPSIIFNQITFPLQLVASRVGEVGMEAFGVPVLREGNVIVLAHTTLEVAEACSGVRSLMSLLTLAIVYGYFKDSRSVARVLIALSAVPIAVVANGARVAGTGIAAHFYGPAIAEGFFHSFSGWIVFAAALVMMFVVVTVVTWLAPRRRPRQSIPAVAAGEPTR